MNNRLENLRLRTRKLYPHTHGVTVDLVKESLEHLKHNSPSDYAKLISGLN